MEENRISLYQGMKSDGDYTKTYKEFITKYFSNTSTIENLYNILIDNSDYTKTLKDFYVKYGCDLDWAKSTTFCGGSGGGGSTTTKPSTQGWDSCVDGVVPPGKIIDDNTITYISSNVKGKVTLKKDHTFTSEVSDYKSGKWSCTASGKIFLDASNSSSSTTDGGGGSSTKPAVSWTDTNATEQDVANGTLIKKFMKGDIVTKIQNHLIKHGFDNISFSKKADGKFGSRTKKMVMDFQTSKGLKSDGVVGPKTWTELIKDKSSVATTTTSGSTTTSGTSKIDTSTTFGTSEKPTITSGGSGKVDITIDDLIGGSTGTVSNKTDVNLDNLGK